MFVLRTLTATACLVPTVALVAFAAGPGQQSGHVDKPATTKTVAVAPTLLSYKPQKSAFKPARHIVPSGL